LCSTEHSETAAVWVPIFFTGDAVSEGSAVHLRVATQNALGECMDVLDADRTAPQERRVAAFPFANDRGISAALSLTAAPGGEHRSSSPPEGPKGPGL